MPKSVYTRQLERELVALVKGGVTIRTAAARCGIGRRTLYDWLSRGAKGEAPYAALRQRLDVAKASAEAAIVRSIYRAAAEDWRAGAWWLERRYPRRYALRARLDITRTPVERLSDAELEAELEALGYVRAERLAELGYVRRDDDDSRH